MAGVPELPRRRVAEGRQLARRRRSLRETGPRYRLPYDENHRRRPGLCKDLADTGGGLDARYAALGEENHQAWHSLRGVERVLQLLEPLLAQDHWGCLHLSSGRLPASR